MKKLEEIINTEFTKRATLGGDINFQDCKEIAVIAYEMGLSEKLDKD